MFLLQIQIDAIKTSQYVKSIPIIKHRWHCPVSNPVPRYFGGHSVFQDCNKGMTPNFT